MGTKKISDDELRTLKADHAAAYARADEDRDAKVRAALADGRTQREVVDLTGYTREAIRRYTLTAEAREDLRRRNTKAVRGTRARKADAGEAS